MSQPLTKVYTPNAYGEPTSAVAQCKAKAEWLLEINRLKRQGLLLQVFMKRCETLDNQWYPTYWICEL